MKAKDTAAAEAEARGVVSSAITSSSSCRTATPEEVCYEVKLPIDRKPIGCPTCILKLDPENDGVEWEEKKPKQ